MPNYIETNDYKIGKPAPGTAAFSTVLANMGRRFYEV